MKEFFVGMSWTQRNLKEQNLLKNVELSKKRKKSPKKIESLR